MIITRTPFRVSLFGGGTDYPAYYQEHGGEVLGFAINRYCWLSLRKLPPYFEHRHRVVYSKVECVQKPSEIDHPVVRAAFELEPPHCGVELVHTGDLPARSGMGSSSAFTVGLLHALSAFRGHTSSRLGLARTAIQLEREVLGENVGSQDQVWAAYGGANRIFFDPDGSWRTESIIFPGERRKELEASLVLVFTGFSRYGSAVAGAQIQNFPHRQRHLARLKAMVGEGAAVLRDAKRSLDDLGRLLDEAWQLKRELAPGVSTGEIDEIYAKGREAGALGGKLLGAGGGGFLLFYAPKGAAERVRETFKGLIEVPFRIGAEGSKVVVYEPEINH